MWMECVRIRFQRLKTYYRIEHWHVIEWIVLSSNSQTYPLFLSNDTWKWFNYQYIHTFLFVLFLYKTFFSSACSTFVCTLVINRFFFSLSLSLSFVYVEYSTGRPFIDIVLLVAVYSDVASRVENKKTTTTTMKFRYTYIRPLSLFAWRNTLLFFKYDLHWQTFFSFVLYLTICR